MKGLNLDGFKKIAEDKNSATLRHAKGHEMRIAKSALSAQMKKELEALPIHKMADGGDITQQYQREMDDAASKGNGSKTNDDQGIGKAVQQYSDEHDFEPKQAIPAVNVVGQYANGGAATSANQSGAMKENYNKKSGVKIRRFADGTPDAPVTQDTPDNTPDSSGMSQDQFAAAMNSGAPQQPVQDMDDESPATVSDTTDNDEQDGGDEDTSGTAATSAPVQQPTVPAQQAQPPVSPSVQPAANPQEMDLHDQQYAADLAQGHITPKTMQDMFADPKNTLGKIGTIFGLIVGGAGAGLSHQQNLLAEMMNQTIQNDLDAQKASASNALTMYNLQNQHQLQQAQIKQMGIQNALAQAQTDLTNAKTPFAAREAQANINALQAQTANGYADAKIKADAHTINGLRINALQHLQNTADGLPEGPTKSTAQGVIDNTLTPAINQKNQQTNAQAAAKINTKNAAQAQQQSAPDTGVNIGKFQQLVQQGRAGEALGVPTGMQSADVGAATQEATKVQDNRAVAGIYDNSFKKLNSLSLAGNLSPGARAAEINALGTQVARATAGRYNANEASAQADGMFPQVGDWPSTRDEKYAKSMQFFKGQEAGTPTLDRYQLKTPFPYQSLGGNAAATNNQALAWAKANPNDPRAKTIMSMSAGQTSGANSGVDVTLPNPQNQPIKYR